MAWVELYQTWKDGKIVDFCTFRYLLSNQMIKYNTTHQKYADETNMRPDTQYNQYARDNIKYDTSGKIGRSLA